MPSAEFLICPDQRCIKGDLENHIRKFVNTPFFSEFYSNLLCQYSLRPLYCCSDFETFFFNMFEYVVRDELGGEDGSI